eukprot:4775609-Amphidinium_carterae.1
MAEENNIWRRCRRMAVTYEMCQSATGQTAQLSRKHRRVQGRPQDCPGSSATGWACAATCSSG